MNFSLNEQECKEWKQFYEKHKDCCSKLLGKDSYSTIGGEFSFRFTPTGLGDLIEIQCNSCKETKDITDVSNW